MATERRKGVGAVEMYQPPVATQEDIEAAQRRSLGGLAATSSLDSIKGMKRISRPPIIKTMELQPGTEILAEIVGIVETQAGTQKGKPVMSQCIHLRAKDGQERYLPLNTVLETALGPDPSAHKGKMLGIRVLEPRTSGNFKKKYFNCEVFLG